MSSSLSRAKAAPALASHALNLLAATVLVLLAIRAVRVFDIGWDTLSYHLPFAVRLAGLCDITCLQMTPQLELFYSAFPVAAEAIQGMLWKLTGLPEATNLLNYFALLALVAYLVRVWKVTFRWAVFGLLTVPMVQIHSTISYIDLATNAAATIGFMTIAGILLERPMPGRWTQAAFVAAVVFLGNAKIQMMPVAGVIGLAFLLLVNRCVPADQRGIWRIGRGHYAGIGWGLALLLLLSATGIRNLLVFGNPVFPVDVGLFGIDILPGVIQPIAPNSVPDYLEKFPQFIRSLLSVAELSAFDGRDVPYTMDMWAPSQSLPSVRMGGYFAAYVFMTGSLVIFSALRLEARLRRRLLVFLALFSFGSALMPASHELRYYIYWILVLVALNLHFLATADRAPDGDRTFVVLGRMTILCCFAAVTLLTGGKYLDPKSKNLASVLDRRGIDRFVAEQVKDGDIVCVAFRPNAILFADFLHPGRHYKVIQDDDPSCTVHAGKK